MYAHIHIYIHKTVNICVYMCVYSMYICTTLQIIVKNHIQQFPFINGFDLQSFGTEGQPPSENITWTIPGINNSCFKLRAVLSNVMKSHEIQFRNPAQDSTHPLNPVYPYCTCPPVRH